MKLFIFPLIVLSLMISGYGMTKKECCKQCKDIEIKCMQKDIDNFINKVPAHVADREKMMCRQEVANCKADCGGGCALLENK